MGCLGGHRTHDVIILRAPLHYSAIWTRASRVHDYSNPVKVTSIVESVSYLVPNDDSNPSEIHRTRKIFTVEDGLQNSSRED